MAKQGGNWGVIHRATVTSVEDTGVIVEIPALAVGGIWGPIPSAVPNLAVDEAVLVGQISTSRDTLIVIGRVPGRAPTVSEIPDLTTTIAALQAADTAQVMAINAHTTRLNTDEANIASNTAAIASNTSRLTTDEANIASNTSTLAGYGTRLTTAETNITSNTTRITALEGKTNLIGQYVHTGSPVVAVTFANIPQTFRDLLLVGRVVQNQATVSALRALFNNDNSAHYDYQYIDADGSTSSSGRILGTAAGVAIGGVSPNSFAGFGGVSQCWIPDYKGAYGKHTIGRGVYFNAGGLTKTAQYSGLWYTATAISRIDLVLDGSSYFAVGTSLSLYGF